jgi:sulfate adenylyltransferase subunit 1 (EFTu-like GTPase family)
MLRTFPEQFTLGQLCKFHGALISDDCDLDRRKGLKIDRTYRFFTEREISVLQ